jgi:hypothetical protein
MVQLELGAHSWTSRQKQGHDNNMEGKRETVIFRKKSVDRKPRKYLPKYSQDKISQIKDEIYLFSLFIY